MLASPEQFKHQLAHEMRHARAAHQRDGTLPTFESHPALMSLWASAKSWIRRQGANGFRVYFTQHGLELEASSLWGERGQLQKFFLRDPRTNSLILVGDTSGPVFTATLDYGK